MIWRRFKGGPGPRSLSASADDLMPQKAGALPSFSWSQAQSLAVAMGRFEARLRGYDLFASPVELEPAFSPFDLSLFLGEELDGLSEAEPHRDLPLSFVRLLLPQEQKAGPDACAALLQSLATLAHPVGLELVGTARTITFQIACARSEAGEVAQALRLAFPQGRFPLAMDAEGDALHEALSSLCAAPAYRIVDAGQGRSVCEPLPSPASWAPDPLAAFIAVLGSLRTGEAAGLQVLTTPARHDWGEELISMASLWSEWGNPDEPDAQVREAQGKALEKALARKLVSPLWVASTRVFAATSQHGPERALDLCQRLFAALPGSAGLLPLKDEGYDARDHLLDVLGRRSRRPGMLLSALDVGALWHPPAETLCHPLIQRKAAPTLPVEVAGLPGTPLGWLEADSHVPPTKVPVVRWPDVWRERHFYALGATRMGKSTLLLNMMARDLREGRGLCLIDPHGDLARDVLSLVPPECEKDVFFLDLSDEAFPPAIGLLDAASEWEERLLVSDLLSIFKRLFASSWGDRLEHLLRHALLTLLADKNAKHTLRDVRPLLGDGEYRAVVLAGVRDPDLQMFWKREFPAYPASALSPLANKLGLLFSSPIVRNIVGGRESRLHFSELMQGRKVLLVDASAGKIGQDGARFLGALLVSRLQLSAMHALRLDRLDRPPFTLYVDEFHAFAVSSFETILSEAGKAGLHLVMANQFLEQLDPHLQTAILSNVGTLLSFRVSASSARDLEREFGGAVEARSLVDLSRGEAVVRLGRAGNTVRIRTFPPPQVPDAAVQAQSRERIRAYTQEQLCRPRAEVEAEIFGVSSPNASSVAGFAPRSEITESEAFREIDAALEEGQAAEQKVPIVPDAEGHTATQAQIAINTESGGPQHFGWADEENE